MKGTTLIESFVLFYKNVKRNNRVLILFDNADDLEVISKYLPHLSISCHVLITTRTTESNELFMQRNSNVLSLETLDKSTAVSALIALSGKREETLSPIRREQLSKACYGFWSRCAGHHLYF